MLRDCRIVGLHRIWRKWEWMPWARAVGPCSMAIVATAARWKKKTNASGSAGQIKSVNKDKTIKIPSAACELWIYESLMATFGQAVMEGIGGPPFKCKFCDELNSTLECSAVLQMIIKNFYSKWYLQLAMPGICSSHWQKYVKYWIFSHSSSLLSFS